MQLIVFKGLIIILGYGYHSTNNLTGHQGCFQLNKKEAVLQIRRGNRDELGIIIHIFP